MNRYNNHRIDHLIKINTVKIVLWVHFVSYEVDFDPSQTSWIKLVISHG